MYLLVTTTEEGESLSLVHLHLSLPLQQRHSSQLDVDVIYAFVEKVSGPLGNLVPVQTEVKPRQEIEMSNESTERSNI